MKFTVYTYVPSDTPTLEKMHENKDQNFGILFDQGEYLEKLIRENILNDMD